MSEVSVPEGWTEESILSLVGNDGLMTDGDWIESKDQDPNGDIRLIQLADIGDGRFINKSSRYMNSEKAAELRTTLLKKGDVLVARMPDPIGRACIFPGIKQNSVTVVDVAILRTNKSVPYWLMSVINTKNIRNQIDLKASGTTRTRISRKELEKLIIKTPPLPEQQKIASILTSVDDVIEKTQSQINKLQDLKKGTMNELLTRGIGHTEFKDSPVGRIPREWEVKKLNEICKVRQGLQIPIVERHKKIGENRYLYVTVALINSGFREENREYIESPKHSVILKKGEILIARTGAVGIIIKGFECVFHNNFFAAKLDESILDSDFFYYFLKSPEIQNEIKKRAGTTTIPDLNHGDFYSLNIGIPSIQEQQKIASILSSIDKTIEEKQRKLQQTKFLKKSLMNDLLTGKVRVSV